MKKYMGERRRDRRPPFVTYFVTKGGVRNRDGRRDRGILGHKENRGEGIRGTVRREILLINSIKDIILEEERIELNRGRKEERRPPDFRGEGKVMK
ncbi:hypothetical protein G7K_4016-t1 [Saitoella complicata NRRL Y-17804]|uniref:Uncharacterized protein n=1 Tax=Saitoella complicata (strain BCRC 22490 / CBS 7301 / JCM 7358 / NBRC 10748 / NRRL Y-17804) TaxID=698492 RepID=A0A0E9NJ65_SAICN|nr:hypothetical protein G7K_4016-t1 [Saitoella complicata NRRL Y-17804]